MSNKNKSSKNNSKKNLAMLGFAKTLCIFAADKILKELVFKDPLAENPLP